MRYRYVAQFKDRHGKARLYFRRPGMKTIPIRGPVGSPQFIADYQAALNTPPIPAGDARKLARGLSAKEWSAQRLKHAVRESMADEGVYLLAYRGKVTYVGSSTNCAKRIKGHKTNGRRFDKAYYIHAVDRERRALERMLVVQMQPPENKVTPPVC